MNREERRAFVAAHRTAVFGTNRKSDGPAQSIVYYGSDGDELLVPPRHVHSEKDVNEKLSHALGNTLPW